MKIQNYFVQSTFSFISEIQSMDTRTKKIAMLAITAFGLLAACYFAHTYVFSRKKASPANPQDQKAPLANDKFPANIKAKTSNQSHQLKKDPLPIDPHLTESPFKPLPVPLSPKTLEANTESPTEIVGSPKTHKDPLSALSSQQDSLPESPSPIVPQKPTAIPVKPSQSPQNLNQKTPPSLIAPPKSPVPHRIPEDKEDHKPFGKVEKPIPFQKTAPEPKSKLGATTPLQMQKVEKVTEQKEEKKEIVYLFSPYNFGSAEQLLSDTYPGIPEIKTSLEKSYQQVVFTNNPQSVKEGAPVLFFLGKNTRIDLHNHNVIQILESLGSNVLVLLFDQNNPNFASYSREEFKNFLKPESVEDGPGKGRNAADVLEKYRNFDSFLIFEYSVSFSNTGVGDLVSTKKFRGNMNPAQEILRKLQEMEKMRSMLAI